MDRAVEEGPATANGLDLDRLRDQALVGHIFASLALGRSQRGPRLLYFGHHFRYSLIQPLKPYRRILWKFFEFG